MSQKATYRQFARRCHNWCMLGARTEPSLDGGPLGSGPQLRGHSRRSMALQGSQSAAPIEAMAPIGRQLRTARVAAPKLARQVPPQWQLAGQVGALRVEANTKSCTSSQPPLRVFVCAALGRLRVNLPMLVPGELEGSTTDHVNAIRPPRIPVPHGPGGCAHG